MEPSFWKQKWEQKEIAFHGSETNPLLVKYFAELSLPKGSRLFLPLCGKTLDIHWLLASGYRVAGAELSGIAVAELFAELGVTPSTSQQGSLTHYQAAQIDIFEGDIFDLTEDLLGPVDAVYDRAALVALPEGLRQQYAQHLTKITNRAPQLLLGIEYDQSLRDGPPFSLPADKIREVYHETYTQTELGSMEIPGGLRGQCPASERAWLLKPLAS
jgi:thiopurine S-methyltransferase